MGRPWFLRPVSIVRKTHLKWLNISDKCSDHWSGNPRVLAPAIITQLIIESQPILKNLNCLTNDQGKRPFYPFSYLAQNWGLIWPNFVIGPKNHHESIPKKAHTQSKAQGYKSNGPTRPKPKDPKFNLWGVRPTYQKCTPRIQEV